MAEQGLRINALTTEQEVYAPLVKLACEPDSATETRFVYMGTIYPKTNTLNVATGVLNPNTVLVRIDNGSGSETQITVANLLKYAQSEVVTIDYTGNDIDFNSENLNCRRKGNDFHVTGSVVSVNSKTNAVLLATIPGYVSPGYTVNFVAQQAETSNFEGGWGFVNTAGEIYFKPGKGSSQIWYININIIGGN